MSKLLSLGLSKLDQLAEGLKHNDPESVEKTRKLLLQLVEDGDCFHLAILLSLVQALVSIAVEGKV